MFDLGFTEILLLGAIALIVLGPEKLPHAARMAGAWYARIRRSISNIQREIEQEVNGLEMKQRVERELASIRAAEQAMRDEVNQIQSSLTGTGSTPDAVAQAVSEITQAYNDDIADPIYLPVSESLRQQRYPPVPYRVGFVISTSTSTRATTNTLASPLVVADQAAADHQRPEATLNIQKQDIQPS